MSVAWGLSRDEALKALTINAAEILGVADRVGSLEPGKIANLFIAKGDPLEVRTRDHARRHHRPRRGARQQAARAVRAVQRSGRRGLDEALHCILAALARARRSSRCGADAPNVYAIRGARIVTAAGAPIAIGHDRDPAGRHRRGRRGVAVPPDADGHRRRRASTVYPGLIDMGNTRAADQPAPARAAEPAHHRRARALEAQRRF